MPTANRGRAAAGHHGAFPRLDAGAHHSCGWTPPVPQKQGRPCLPYPTFGGLLHARETCSTPGAERVVGFGCACGFALLTLTRFPAPASWAPGLRPPIWLPTRRRVSRGWDRERQSAPPPAADPAGAGCVRRGCGLRALAPQHGNAALWPPEKPTILLGAVPNAVFLMLTAHYRRSSPGAATGARACGTPCVAPCLARVAPPLRPAPYAPGVGCAMGGEHRKAGRFSRPGPGRGARNRNPPSRGSCTACRSAPRRWSAWRPHTARSFTCTT